MQNESKFKIRVLKDLKKLQKCWVLKTQERTRRGVPDLIINLSGRFIAIELKVDGEEPTPLQQAVLTEIMEANGVAFSTSPRLWENHFQMLQELSQ